MSREAVRDVTDSHGNDRIQCHIRDLLNHHGCDRVSVNGHDGNKRWETALSYMHTLKGYRYETSGIETVLDVK